MRDFVKFCCKFQEIKSMFLKKIRGGAIVVSLAPLGTGNKGFKSRVFPLGGRPWKVKRSLLID